MTWETGGTTRPSENSQLIISEPESRPDVDVSFADGTFSRIPSETGWAGGVLKGNFKGIRRASRGGLSYLQGICSHSAKHPSTKDPSTSVRESLDHAALGLCGRPVMEDLTRPWLQPRGME